MIKAIFFDYHGVLDRRTFKGFLNFLAELLYEQDNSMTKNEHLLKIRDQLSNLGIKYASGEISPQEFWKIIKKNNWIIR